MFYYVCCSKWNTEIGSTSVVCRFSRVLIVSSSVVCRSSRVLIVSTSVVCRFSSRVLIVSTSVVCRFSRVLIVSTSKYVAFLSSAEHITGAVAVLSVCFLFVCLFVCLFVFFLFLLPKLDSLSTTHKLHIFEATIS